MKVFVTGATGFVGKHIVRRLLADGYEVAALLLPAEPSALDNKGVKIVRGDITEPLSLKGKMKGSDAVIHLAGAVGYGQSMDTCVRINRYGTYNVAREAIASGVRRFIHFSSVSVYGRVPGIPITEDQSLRKIGDPYGDTKVDAENILKEFAAEGWLDLTIVRPTVIYGPGDDKFLPKLIENLRSGKARIIGSGENTVDLVHVNDVADFIALLLKDERSIGQVYNLTNPYNPSWKEFLSIVAFEVGVPVPRKHVPYGLAMVLAGLMEFLASLTGKEAKLTRYAVRVIGRQYYYVTDKALRELGFRPRINLGDGIRECVAEYIGQTQA